MDIVTLGAALNSSAEYVKSHFKGGSNIQIVDNPDGTQTINASGEVSAEDTVARADISAIKDGETLDSFGDVEAALGSKADKSTTYTKTEVDTALDDKVDKVSGKGLSTNDFTTAEKTKINDLAEIKSIGTGLNLDSTTGELTATGGGGGGGTSNYNELSNRPQINSTTLTGNKTSSDLGLQSTIDSSHKISADLIDDTSATNKFNVQADWNQTTDTASDYIKNKPTIPAAQVNSDWNASSGVSQILNKPTLGTAAAKNVTDTYNSTGDDVTTGKAVAAALATLPEPMIFKGSLGTGGTITTLPTASSSNKGYEYKVITAGTYASQSAKVGDTFISDGSAWVLIPSGDEPSGTVTNVTVANGGGLSVSGSPVTSSGTITIGHSNSVTAKTTSSVKKFTYDAYGHVTGSSELSTAESDALASGIDSTKVTQIATNASNISSLTTAVSAKIGAADYATQAIGGTVKVWTTTESGETTLHISTQ